MTFKRVFVMLLCLLSLTAGAEAQVVCEPLASGEMVGQVVEILTGKFANWEKSGVTVSYPGQPNKFYDKTAEAMKKVQTGSLVCVPDSMARPIQRASFAEVMTSVSIVPVVVPQQPIERPASQVDALGYVGYNGNPQVARSNLMFYRPSWMTMKTGNTQPTPPDFGSMLADLNPSASSGWLMLQASFSQLSAPDFGSMLAQVTPSSFNWPLVLLAAVAMLLLEVVLRYRNRPKSQHGKYESGVRLHPPVMVEAPISPQLVEMAAPRVQFFELTATLPVQMDSVAPSEPAEAQLPWVWDKCDAVEQLITDSDDWVADHFPGLRSATAAA